VLGFIARKRVVSVWGQFSGLLALTFAGSVACAAVAYVSYRGIAGTTGGIVREIGAVLVPAALGGAVYLAVLLAAQVPEIHVIKNRVGARLPAR
jgi:hypothetical protein